MAWLRIPISEIKLGDRLGISGLVKSISDVENEPNKIRVRFELDGAYIFNKDNIVNIYRLYNNYPQ